MSGLCGWIGVRRQEDAQTLERMASCLTRHDQSKRQTVFGQTSALCVASLSADADVCRDGDWLAAICGQYYWNDTELRLSAEDQGAAQVLLRSFQAQDVRFLDRLQGCFSIALIHEARRFALLITDRVGVQPINYVSDNHNLVFSSDVAALQRHPDVPSDINPQAVFNYLYFHTVPAPISLYTQHRRLLPGHFVKWNDGKLTTDAYWSTDYQETNSGNTQRLKSEFRKILSDSVQRAAQGEKSGAFLSGGTDSSTISGTLREVVGGPVSTYSIGFDTEGYDELAYARIAAKHFATDHHEYYVTPDDVIAAIPKIANIYGEPFGNSSAVPTYYCARMAKSDGVTRLLAGDGGDELFAGNERYAKQHVFAFYERLPQVLRWKLLEPLSRRPAFVDSGITPLRKVCSYVQQASVEMPGRLQTYNLLERIGLDEVLEPEFRERVDIELPLRMLTEHYDRVRANTMLNKMLGLDLKFTLADNDLPKVSKMCELAGVEAAYPLLDDELVAFAGRLSPALKLRGSRLRYFFKEALRDFLPGEILTKAKHGFGLPFGRWLVEHQGLAELANDNLTNLKSRHIVRPVFIDRLMSDHLPSHPHYYGTMVWVLIMLEQWYQQHVDRHSSAG